MERRRLKEAPPETGGLYFPLNPGKVPCIPTGCTLLDCVLGGGWAEGRIANIVGDKAVGKSLLAIEACANFALKYPKGRIYYRECEAAFDEGYAEQLGLPVSRVDFGPEGLNTIWDTVEDIFEDIDAKLTECEKAKVPSLYIVDSLDALSSRAEMERKPGEATFGLEKQKMMGTLFRKLVRRIKNANMMLIFISQVRDKIGVVFGEKHTRTGGKALDFYASQILWLSHLETLNRTVKGVKRAVGVRIKAKCKKNKVGLPFREAEFEIAFNYGINDIAASLDWLQDVKAFDRLGLPQKTVDEALAMAEKLEGAELSKFQQQLRETTVAVWAEVEGRFAPVRRKYG